MFLYKIFGSVIVSNIALPELAPIDPEITNISLSDSVLLTEGTVPEHLKDGRKFGEFIETNQSACLFHVPDVGRFLLESRASLSIERYPGVPITDMRAWLFGLALPALAMQRGFIPLHISAVMTPKGVWAFTGHSGAGKSTLAIQLCQKFGWKLLSDDLMCINSRDERPLLYCGVRSVRLCDDSLKQLKLQYHSEDLYYGKTDKYQIDGSNFFVESTVDGQFELVGLLQISWAAECIFKDFIGAQKFVELTRAIYRPEIVPMLMLDHNPAKDIFKFAENICIGGFQRPKDSIQSQRQIDLIHQYIIDK
jgi:hypothetical protein